MARGPILTRSKAWMEMMRQHYANMGKQSRSVASNIFPHLNSNNPATMRAMNPRPQSTTAARLYPHLPSSASSRVQQPKPKPRASRARRIYGDLE
jgi:hypothetical protein